MFLGIFMPAQAYSREQVDPACKPATTAPNLIITIAQTPLTLDHSQSRDMLKQIGSDLKSPYPDHYKSHVNGLMRSKIDVKSNVQLSWQKYTNFDVNCFNYTEIRITATLQPNMYVAKEIPSNTCLYNEVVRHENKHYEVDKGILSAYQSTLQFQLNQLLRKYPAIGPYKSHQIEEAKAWMHKQIELIIQSTHDQLQSLRMKQQASIDTIQEYNRVAAACPGDQGVM
jgi:hypothetical protein